MTAAKVDWPALSDLSCCGRCPVCGVSRASTGRSAVVAHLMAEQAHDLPVKTAWSIVAAHKARHSAAERRSERWRVLWGDLDADA